MSTVPKRAFTSGDISLEQPKGGASVSRAQAEGTAKAAYHADRVQETVLAEVVKPGGFDKLCWVVALPPAFAPPFEVPLPPSGHTAVSSPPAAYLVVFIDAGTGSPIFSSMGTDPGGAAST